MISREAAILFPRIIAPEFASFAYYQRVGRMSFIWAAVAPID